MKKLKSDKSITGAIPPVLSLLVLGLVSTLFDLQTGLNALGAVIIIYASLFGLLPYLRTGNINFIVVFFYLIILGLFMINFEPHMLKSRGGRLDNWAAVLFVLIYFFMFWIVFLFANKKLKWRGREIMELIATHVEAGEDTYTDRPRPVGKISGTKSDITSFAEYVRKKLIFMSSEEGDRVVLVPVKMGHEFNILIKSNIDTSDFSRITIDFEGNVAVHISKRDYLDYKEDLSFSQLSDALGQIVIDFYNQYVNHEEVRIMDRINSIKVGYFS